MKILFLTFSLSFFIALFSFGQSPEDYMKVARKAVELFDNEEFEESIPYFDQLIRWRPNKALSYIMKGRALFFIGEKHGGIECLTYATKIEPENAEVFYYRSLMYSQLEFDELAVKDIREALKLDHENKDYLFTAANFSSKAGYYERAIKLYETLIQKGLENLEVFYFTGFSYFMFGDSTNAAKYLNMALKEIARSEQSYQNDMLKSSILSAFGKEQEALECSLNAIGSKPDDSYAYQLAADSYRVFKRWDKALEMTNLACQVEENNHVVLINKAYFLTELDSLEEAKDILDTLIELYPNSYNILVTSAYLYIKLGQPDKAITWLNIAIENRPNHPGAYKVRAQYYFAINEGAKGCEDIHLAISKGHQRMYNNDDALQLLGENCN